MYLCPILRACKNHLYSVLLVPRAIRMADAGAQIAQMYLPYDQLIGVIGEAGSASRADQGMFPAWS